MLLKEKNFRLLIGSQLFSVLGTTIVQFAISLYILDLTKSAVIFSLVMSLSVVGRLICLPFGGVLADRLPKKKLMIVMDFFYLILSLGLFFVSKMSQSITVICILVVILGMVAAFETPVVQSTIPLVCDKNDIPQGNGIISSIGMLGNIVAPALAGIIYRFEHVYIVFAVCSFLFFLAILSESFLKIEYTGLGLDGKNIKEVVVGDIKETLHFLRKEGTILKICWIAFLLNLFISSFVQVIIPYVARVQLEVTNGQFGLMNTLFALGSLGGTLLFSVLGHKFSHRSLGKLLLMNSLLFCTLILPLCFIQTKFVAFWILVPLVTLILCVFTMVSVQLVTYIQLMVESTILGRVMSFVLIISTLAIPLGQMIYGSLGGILTKFNLLFLVLFLAVLSSIIAMYSTKVFSQMSVVKD